MTTSEGAREPARGSLDYAVGANVRALRARRGMRQEDLGQATGLGRNVVAALENGSRRVMLDDLPILCEALGVDLGGLLTGSEGLRLLGVVPRAALDGLVSAEVVEVVLRAQAGA